MKQSKLSSIKAGGENEMQQNDTKAYLSVIADSAIVEVWIMD